MRVVVHGKPRQRECAAVAGGFTALGAAVSWLAPKYWQSADFDPSADLVVTFGQRVHSARIAETYREHGVAVLTVDLPPIRVRGMADTHRSLWLNHVNWMPSEPMPLKRWDSFGLELQPLKWGARVLLCGQTADDAAHGMSSFELKRWAQASAHEIAKWKGVLWRPHPENWFRLAGYEMQEPTERIEDVLAKGWHALVTYNSTTGITALLSGVPVFCDPSSFYAELANTSLARLTEPRWPSVEDRLSFFSRLAYVQWTFAELASGKALDFILQYLPERQVSAA